MNINKVFNVWDYQTAGCPIRMIVGGVPFLRGKTMLEKMYYMRDNYDWIRTVTLMEPRGHNDQMGAVLCEPTTDEADIGIFYIETVNYVAMCGAGTISVARAAVEMGLVKMVEPVTTVKIDTPAGMVTALVDVKDGHVQGVRFQSVEAFLYKENLTSKVDGVEFKYDIMYGGHFFNLVDITQFGLTIEQKNVPKVAKLGIDIVEQVNKEQEAKHPTREGLPEFVECTMFYQPAYEENGKMINRNSVIFGHYETDRSPCGTGTTARLATLYTRGQLALNEEFIHESVLGTRFVGKVIGVEEVAGYKFCQTEVKGNAYPTGFNTFVIDKDDPFKEGFLLGR